MRLDPHIRHAKLQTGLAWRDLKELADLSRGRQFFIARPRRFGKPITLIGISFSTKKRAVSGAKIVRGA